MTETTMYRFLSLSTNIGNIIYPLHYTTSTRIYKRHFDIRSAIKRHKHEFKHNTINMFIVLVFCSKTYTKLYYGELFFHLTYLTIEDNMYTQYWSSHLTTHSANTTWFTRLVPCLQPYWFQKDQPWSPRAQKKTCDHTESLKKGKVVWARDGLQNSIDEWTKSLVY